MLERPPYLRDGAAIYERSFAIIRAEANLSRFSPEEAEIAVRMIHACGQVSVADSIHFAPGLVKAAREATERFAHLVDHEYWPGMAVQSDEALREAIESNSWGHHANGTARMGRRGEMLAVVDGDLKVIGTSNVRISDASVFPHTPGSFIASAVVQIGEAAAIKAIAEARGQSPLAVLDTIMQQA